MGQREDGVDDVLKPILGMIRESPELTSLLYDIDMLPEQTVTLAGAIRLNGLCAVWKRYALYKKTLEDYAVSQVYGASAREALSKF